VLSRLPIRTARVEELPVAGRAQGRSLVRAELEVAGGEPLTLLATHLQHRNDESAMEARLREIELIIGEWGGARRTLLVGDLNPRQGDPPLYPTRRPGEFAEIRALLDAGFTTAQDLAACSEPTSGRNCTDFVLVSPDLHQAVSVPAEDGKFDHRPVVSTVQTG
jgi:endonuclease/exonuclease/phosphatase family metal-dependent hydrolase